MNPQERTLADLWADIARAGWWLTGGIVIAGAAAVLFVFLATPFFRAQMIVSPASPMNAVETSTGNENAFVSHYLTQRGGFQNSADFLRFENMIAGPSVAAKLLTDEKITRGLAMDKTFESSGARSEWSAEELAEYISARVKLQPVGASPLRRMVYFHPSREFGVYFLHRLHRVTDESIRASVRGEAAERIRYLQDTSKDAINPEHRRALTELLLEQERLRMLASIDQPYAAAIVEPPASSSKAQWPDALLIVPAFMFAGALLGFILHGLFAAERRHYPVSFKAQKGWYKTGSINSNDRRLLKRDAAE